MLEGSQSVSQSTCMHCVLSFADDKSRLVVVLIDVFVFYHAGSPYTAHEESDSLQRLRHQAAVPLPHANKPQVLPRTEATSLEEESHFAAEICPWVCGEAVGGPAETAREGGAHRPGQGASPLPPCTSIPCLSACLVVYISLSAFLFPAYLHLLASACLPLCLSALPRERGFSCHTMRLNSSRANCECVCVCLIGHSG
jgi:hypothetical protein